MAAAVVAVAMVAVDGGGGVAVAAIWRRYEAMNGE